MATAALRNFFSFARRQRWALFFYFSLLVHLSLFTHLAVYGLKKQELEICNQPMIQIQAQVVPAPQTPGEQSQPNDGGGFGHGPMAEAPGAGEGEGDFAKEFGIPGGKWKEQLDRTEEGEALNDSYKNKNDETAINKSVPEEYRNRKRDYRNIIAKDIFPTLKTIDKPFREELKEAPQELEKMLERNEVIENYRLWREGKAIPDKKRAKVVVNRKAEGGLGRLNFDESARRKYFDNTISEPKEAQLDRFLRDYGNYDPNDGDLPRAIRDLYFENLQRVASTFNPDKTYLAIDYFHEALNKEEFLRKALDVAAKKKGTKYGTEILFAIENIYEIQGRALDLLFEMKNHIASLPPEARKNIRVETLEKLVKRYMPLAEKKGIRNGADAMQHYFLKRTEILDYLTENTPGGYRVKDATFAKGKVFWESATLSMNPGAFSQAKRAVEIWRTVDQLADSGDFVAQDLFNAMRDPLSKFRELNSLEGRQISSAMHLNMMQLMQKKTERENRLLWSSKTAKAGEPATRGTGK